MEVMEALDSAVDPLATETTTNGNTNGTLESAPLDDQVKMQSELPGLPLPEIDASHEELKKVDDEIPAVMLEDIPVSQEPSVGKILGGNVDMPEQQHELIQAELYEVIPKIHHEVSPEVHPELMQEHHALISSEHHELISDEQNELIPAEQQEMVHADHFENHQHADHIDNISSAEEEEETQVLQAVGSQEEVIHAEMAEIHQEQEEILAVVQEDTSVENIQLQLDDTVASAHSETDHEGEMILEETTGEYVLASSLKERSENPEEKMLKEEPEDPSSVIKMIEQKGELKPGEQLVVVTSDGKGNTKEVLLTHTKTVIENGVAVQHVVDENGEVYLIESLDSAEEVEEEDQPSMQTRAKRNQRKLQIPNHVLGRNIINPVEDTFRNGKAPPKPRLGVKIPYRNLTSQIVSKQEIAEEILERSRRFSRENPRQNLFARKLTQNLAKKLQTKDKDNSKSPLGAKIKTRSTFSKEKKDSDKLDNSDLLAILEGDDGTMESTASSGSQKDSKEEMTAEMEREIALKQLSELPDDPPESEKSAEKEATEKKFEKKGGERVKSPFKGSVPLKTYGRKRKTSSEDILFNTNPKSSPSPQESHSQKAQTKIPHTQNPSPDAQPVTLRVSRSNPSTVTSADSSNYVTKSSRVIKRKVIWDPDVSTPKKGIKVEATPVSKETRKDMRKAVHEVRKEFTSPPRREVKKPESPKRIPQVVELKEEPISDDERETPEKETPAPKTKRRLNEVSKLLMDEGAVNMLYSIKNDDAPCTRTQKSQQSKANEIMNELNALQTTDRSSPKALRKKEPMSTPAPLSPARTARKIMQPPTPSPISRQKSKDSNRSSVHSPPPSPGQSFGGIESRIIRRHSSSSYSSMGEEDDTDERRVKKMEGRGRRRTLQAATIENDKKKVKVESANTSNAKPMSQIKSKNDHFEKLVDIKLAPSEKYNKYKKVSISSLNKLVQIDLKVNAADECSVYLTNELMTELIAVLTDLEADKNVNVVLITSSGSIFCNGVNFKSLIIPKEATRKTAAKKLAKTINEFLLCLAKFPKVLAAGIHGDTFGIGVTMLPLFDMIIAHEDASFTIPNAKLGCLAEGGSLLLLPHLFRNVLVNELLYSSQTMSTEDALKLGLVTKILAKDTYERELLSAVKNVSDKSAQFMVSTKKQLRKGMIPDITTSLEDETENLVEQWTSDECQKNFAEFFDSE